MADLLRQLQSALLFAASSVDAWRDAAVAVLALVVVGCLWLYAEAIG